MSLISLNFSNYQNYEISRERFEKVVFSRDKAEATYMGIWDRIKDIFRTESKARALNVLYDLLHMHKIEDEILEEKKSLFCGSLSKFEKLQSFTGEAYKESFRVTFSDHDGVPYFNFFIDIPDKSQNPIYREPASEFFSSISFEGKALMYNFNEIAYKCAQEYPKDFSNFFSKETGKSAEKGLQLLQKPTEEVGADDTAYFASFFFQYGHGKELIGMLNPILSGCFESQHIERSLPETNDRFGPQAYNSTFFLAFISYFLSPDERIN